MSVRVSWGTGIALTYALFALATSGFVAFAMGRRVDLVSSDYYERSLQLERRLTAKRNAAAIGDAVLLEQKPGAIAITLGMSDAQSATGRILLYRSSDAHADREMPLALDAAGRQVVAIAGLKSGSWSLQLEWRLRDRDYYVERQLTLP
jgi:nitrogen fixation protein FixH